MLIDNTLFPNSQYSKMALFRWDRHGQEPDMKRARSGVEKWDISDLSRHYMSASNVSLHSDAFPQSCQFSSFIFKMAGEEST